MYFPKGFSTELSIELGELIQQAYAQFEAFEHEEDWNLVMGYSLRREIHYIWTPEGSIERGIHNYDATIRRFARSRRNKETMIPIGFVAQCDQRRYLIFRGTQTAREWVRNFSTSLTPYLLPSYGRVHEGFLQTYSSIRDEIMDVLSSTNHRAKIYVAGHSLGAALATLALPDIEANTGCRVSALYTYGSPRVGDAAFASAFNRSSRNRSFRIANSSDLVTHIPLPVPLAGIVGGYFSHVDMPVDMTVQEDDLETNHTMQTYLKKLHECTRRKGMFAEFLARMRLTKRCF